MPVKKTKTKKTTPSRAKKVSPTKKRSVGNQAKNQIKEMVNALPGLIAADLHMQSQSESADYVYSQSAYDPHKKRLVFLGVGGVMAVILLFWIVNTRARIYDAQNTTSVESTLITEAKLGLGSVLVDLESQDSGAVKEAMQTDSSPKDTKINEDQTMLRQNLIHIFATLASSTSSTVHTNTTSPELPE